jgi:hypothetical protein
LTLSKKQILICPKNIEHIFVFPTSAKIQAVLHVCRGPMDTRNKALVHNSMKTLIIVLEFAMYSLELEIKF